MLENENTLDRVTDILKIIANSTRMAIVLILSKQGPLSVSALQALLPVEQSSLSHHLIKMKDKRILASERKGKEMHYSVHDPSLIDVVNLLLKLQ